MLSAFAARLWAAALGPPRFEPANSRCCLPRFAHESFGVSRHSRSRSSQALSARRGRYKVHQPNPAVEAEKPGVPVFPLTSTLGILVLLVSKAVALSNTELAVKVLRHGSRSLLCRSLPCYALRVSLRRAVRRWRPAHRSLPRHHHRWPLLGRWLHLRPLLAVALCCGASEV